MSFIEGVVIIVLLFCITVIILLAISKNAYQGKIIVEIDENKAVRYTLEFDGDPYEISNLKNVTFKVVRKGKNAD